MLLTEDQQALREVARRFARERLRPDYQKREAEARVDRKLYREMGELGLLGVDLQQEHGGMGLDGVTAGLLIEDIAYGDFNVSYLQLLTSLMGSIIARNARPEIARAWVPKLVRGEAIVGLGLTEPRGGSDAANLTLRARRDGSDYVLSGEKTSMTFSDQADAAIVFARTGKPEEAARGVTAFLVPLDAKGVQRTRFNDLGSKIIGRGSLFLDDVRVPEENLLGREGTGFTQVMQGFDYSRILIGLQCIGAAQASLDETWVKPVPSRPRRFSSGTRTSSRNSEPRPMILLPRSLKRVRCTPFASSGTRNAVTPRAASSGLPVRANTIAASAWSEKVIEVFSPERT